MKLKIEYQHVLAVIAVIVFSIFVAGAMHTNSIHAQYDTGYPVQGYPIASSYPVWSGYPIEVAYPAWYGYGYWNAYPVATSYPVWNGYPIQETYPSTEQIIQPTLPPEVLVMPSEELTPSAVIRPAAFMDTVKEKLVHTKLYRWFAGIYNNLRQRPQ